MKSLAALMIMVLSLFAIPALAGGNSNGPSSNDSQASSYSSSGAIAGAVSGSSSRTSVNVGGSPVTVGSTNVTTGDTKAYGGSSRAYGGSSKAYAGDSKAKSNSGGNKLTSVNIEEAADIPVASAIAGIASTCVDTMAAQARNGGFSLGSESAECKAASASERFFKLASTAASANDNENAKFYLSQAHYYARLSAPGRFGLAMKSTSKSMIDISIILGLGKLLVGAF